MATAVAKHAGARYVVTTDMNPYRLELAKKMGATVALDVREKSIAQIQKELGMKEGFDVGLEMSGSGQAFRDMIANMCHGGKLALLGIPHEQIVPATRHAHLAPNRLLVSSIQSSVSRAKTEFLFRRLTAHVTPWAGPAPRIFITRRGPRSIINESEVLRALRPLGFESHCLEGMRLADQISLFSRAECVIGPHGAGLTNLVFCRPGTKVAEIGTPYRPWACFYEIAHHRGLDYHLHMASPVRIRHFSPQTAVGDSDLRVDPAELRDVVESLLTGRFHLPQRLDLWKCNA
jgi:hypothetical protein